MSSDTFPLSKPTPWQKKPSIMFLLQQPINSPSSSNKHRKMNDDHIYVFYIPFHVSAYSLAYGDNWAVSVRVCQQLYHTFSFSDGFVARWDEAECVGFHLNFLKPFHSFIPRLSAAFFSFYSFIMPFGHF